MTEAKRAPNLPGWMVEHANRYLSSGGADGHMFKPTQPGRPDIIVPSLLLTTTGRKSGQKFIFPLCYGKTGDSYFVVASKGGAPQHGGTTVGGNTSIGCPPALDTLSTNSTLPSVGNFRRRNPAGWQALLAEAGIASLGVGLSALDRSEKMQWN
jgi:F420H(2)-dependent quinone reductase